MVKEDIHFIFDPIQQEEIDLIKDVNRILTERPPTIEEIIVKRFTRACFYQKKKELIKKIEKEKGISKLPPKRETIIIKIEEPEIKEVRIAPIPISMAQPPRLNIQESFANLEPAKIGQEIMKEPVEAKPLETKQEVKQEVPQVEFHESLSGFQESSFDHHTETKEEPKVKDKPKASETPNEKQKANPVIKPESIEAPPPPPTMEKFTDLVLDEEGKSIVKVRIVKDNISGDMLYEVQEPTMYNNLFAYAIKKNLSPTNKNFEKYVEKYCKSLNINFNGGVVDSLRYHLFKYNSPFGPIDPLIHDSDIMVISSTLTTPISIKYRSNEVMKTNLKIENQDYIGLIRNLADLIHQKLSPKEPSVEGIYQNLKFTLNIGGIVKPSFTIEKLS